MNHQPLNAHMNQRSSIQLIADALELKEAFFESLANLCEQFTINDKVFCCDDHGIGRALEMGYYGEVAEYDTLNEAKQNCNIFLQGIRIHGDKFAVGNLYTNLADVKEDIIIDLKNSVIL